MLIWRLTFGTLMVAALAGLCWLDFYAARPGVYLLPLAVLLALAVAGELLSMFRESCSRVSPRFGDGSLGETAPPEQPLSWAIYGGVLLAVLAAGAPVLWQPYPADGPLGRLGWLAIGLAAGLVLVAVGEMRRYQSPGQVTVNLGLAMLAIVYAGGLMGFVVALRLLGGGAWGDDGRWGMVALVSLVAVVKLSDIGQYTAGRLYGKRKLAPTISPGKTWEGVLGGLVGALLGALVTIGLSLALPAHHATDYSIVRAVVVVPIYALVVAAAGMVGDLAASLIKRDAGVKDSSTWLPGFGGVVDLLDSLLLAAPVAYLFWALRFVGP